ncbi:MAG: sulfotransferase [Alphaproteobacteria bacterium]|nr:sulfotransferase [Alphaproteobacteria bacterium]
MGRFDEVRTAYKQAIAVKPSFPAPYKNLAHGRRVTPDDGLIERIQGVLAKDTLPDRDRSVFNFALGKCFNDIQDYDAAFRHYEIANELSGKSRGFDLATLTDEFDRLISTFTPEFFEAQTSPGSDSERPVFILGMPRSGTTLVEQIIASHPLVFGAGGLMTINRVSWNLPAALKSGTPYPECVALMDEKLVEKVASGCLKELGELSDDAARVTDKMPNNFRHVGLIARLFPRARIIHCQCNPMDICLSCYFLDFRGRLDFAYDLTHLGQYYRQYERLMAHWKKVSPIPILDVRYEDLIADPENVSRRMIDYCGLEWDDACLAHDETERPVMTASHWQARQPIYQTSVERWRRYETHLGPLKAALSDAD